MIIFLGFGIWFWILVMLELCFLTWFVESKWPLPSLASIAIFLILIWWLEGIPVWSWIRENPVRLGIYCLYYTIGGLVWTSIKYYFILKKMKSVILKSKAHWMNIKTNNPSETSSFKQYLEDNKFSIANESRFENTTSTLVFYAMFWPTSCVWTILNEPVKKFFKFLVNDMFIGIFKTMYKYMIEKQLQD